jgi:hypothetical protein
MQYQAKVPSTNLGASCHLGTSVRQRQTVTLGVAHRHQFSPEMIIETQIQQRTVHVEQNGLNP